MQVTRALADKFQLKEFGDVGRYLNLQVEHRNGSFFLHQRSYIESVMEKFRMQEAKWAKTPGPDGVLSKSMCPQSDDERKEMADVPYKSAVGSLLYASGGTRPDIAFAVNTCSQFSQDPGRQHWQAVKRILRYLTKTKHIDIVGFSSEKHCSTRYSRWSMFQLTTTWQISLQKR